LRLQKQKITAFRFFHRKTDPSGIEANVLLYHPEVTACPLVQLSMHAVATYAVYSVYTLDLACRVSQIPFIEAIRGRHHIFTSNRGGLVR
jgi:hypothetical protein